MPPKREERDYSRVGTCAVVVPCFNEADRLPAFLQHLAEFKGFAGWQVSWILVDDGSIDGTAAIMDDAAALGIEVVKLAVNAGKGAAVRAGARAAADRFDVVAFLDVDLSTPLEAIGDGLSVVSSGGDLAIASRHAPGAKLIKPQSALRILVGRAFSFFTSLFHRYAFTDTQCGLKLWTKAFNQEIVANLESERWSFDLELILRAERLGYVVQEFGVSWTNDERSKVSVFDDGIKMLRETVAHWWKWADKRLWFATLFFLVLGISQALRSSNDFEIYFTGAWNKIAHGDLNIYDVARKTQGGYYYSPFFALIGSWFSRLGFVPFKIVYALASAFGILAGWVLIKRLLRNANLPITVGVGFLVLITLANNILGQMLTGNVSLWMSLLCLASLYFSTRSRPIGAALFWALAINIKIYPAYLGLYYLWKRDFRTIIYCGIFSLALLMFPALFFGWTANLELHRQQIEMVKAYGPQNNFGRLAYQSFAAMGYRIFGQLGFIPSLGLKIGQAAALGLNLYALAQLNRKSLRDSVWAIAWTLACMALMTPASWVHHSGFSYAPLFALAFATAVDKKNRALNVLLLVAVLCYSFTTQGMVGDHLNDVLEFYSVPTWGLIFLCIAMLKAKRGQSQFGLEPRD